MNERVKKIKTSKILKRQQTLFYCCIPHPQKDKRKEKYLKKDTMKNQHLNKSQLNNKNLIHFLYSLVYVSS